MARYKPYEKYKDSGVEWIGEVPEHWEVSKIKYVADYINGYAFKPDEWTNEGKKIIRIQNLTNPATDYNRYDGSISNKYVINSGDILLSWSASLGVYVWNDEPSLLNQHIFKVVPNKALVCQQFYIWLANWFIEELKKDIHGSTMQHLTKDKFGRFVLYLPHIHEQQVIANFLDQKTTEIDGLIADKEKLVSLLQEYRQAIISEAVTKGLDPDVKMKDSGVEWIGEIPEHWDVSNLGYKSRMIVPMRDKPVNLTGDVPWIRIEDFKGKYISESVSGQGVETELINKMNLKVYPNGTVLCSCSCTMGRTAIVASPLISNQTFIGIVPSQQLCSSYLYYLMQVCSEWLQYLGQGAIQQYLSRHDFEHLKVTFPPISEQQAIADYLDQKTTEINDLISGIQKSIAQLKSYRQSLISEAVTGKIDVRGVI
jgi:type I restriction enzyme S subunit